MAVHYVANLVITKVTTEATGGGESRRTKSEDLKTTIKADNLQRLKHKVVGHLNIMEEVDLDG